MENNNSLGISESRPGYGLNDDLYTPEVGSWAETKYRLVRMYNELFSTGMKKLWHKRVYIDLFAGAGKARIRKSNKTVLASPLLALNVPDKYDRYIFCDEDQRNIEALKARVAKEYSNIDVKFIVGDCNEKIEDILALIPRPSSTNRVLSFCFVDPFSLNIEFETIKKLSQYLMDFLILLALSMDANRNESIYVDENNLRIDKFLGITDWRPRWEMARQINQSFRKFLALEYANQMANLRYKKDSLRTMIEMRSEDNNLPLYHLAFYSRDPKGYQFWKEVRKYAIEPTLF